MSNKTLETYFHEGEGYNPFLISDGWQVAQLNHLPSLELANIRRMEVHQDTDEVFILFRGEATLLVVDGWVPEFSVTCVPMKPGVTYNVPAGTWHNIITAEGAQIIIVEKSETHLHDVTYRELSESEKNYLDRAVERPVA